MGSSLTGSNNPSAIENPANKFPDSDDYGWVSYVKTALWLYAGGLRWKIKLMLFCRTILPKFKFKHPEPADIRAAFEEAIGANLAKFFRLTMKEGAFE